eukprot:6064664-Lingulodinium_polyedra.AAC.1
MAQRKQPFDHWPVAVDMEYYTAPEENMQFNRQYHPEALNKFLNEGYMREEVINSIEQTLEKGKD